MILGDTNVEQCFKSHIRVVNNMQISPESYCEYANSQ